MLSKAEAARELLARRKARKNLSAYIKFLNPNYETSYFSDTVCTALDQFIEDMLNGVRPILILAAPPQHGKSEIVSRNLPAYIMGRFPDLRIGSASYGELLAGTMAQDVRRKLASVEHKALFPPPSERDRFAINRTGEFSSPNGRGSYIGVGVGTGLSGRPLDLGIIDDPIKDAKEALSQTVKDGVWNWYQSVFNLRMSEHSGQIIMATRWAEDDLTGRIIEQNEGSDRLKILSFPAINEPDEVNYNPDLPRGALVPALHPIEQLNEIKATTSDYFWCALFQQAPKALGGNVFKEVGIHYYLPKDLPKKFDKIINSWDCTFKDTDGTDFVVGQVWGKAGANSYLLDQVRARMSFTKTIDSVVALREKWPQTREILIEDKANGPAVIDVLKTLVPCLVPIEPDGSKLARAHAVTSYWEAGNIFIPSPEICPWVKALVNELTSFPAGAHDDQVDSLSQGLRHLYPPFGKINISKALLDRAKGIR